MHPRIVTFFAAAFLLGTLQACGKQATSDAFDENFRSSFVESCINSGVAQGVRADAMEQVCRCTADDLISKHDNNELASLNVSPEKALPSAEACIQKLGIEPKADVATGTSGNSR